MLFCLKKTAPGLSDPFQTSPNSAVYTQFGMTLAELCACISGRALCCILSISPPDFPSKFTEKRFLLDESF
jgi:hypothetical protein